MTRPVAVVTGSSAGIGAATAIKFAESGYNVVVNYSRDPAPALEVARAAEFVDLDGPLWLQDDYPDGVRLHDGLLMPPAPGFWGG